VDRNHGLRTCELRTHIQLQHRTEAVGHGRDDEGAEHDGHGNGFRVLIDDGPLLQAGVLVLGELADGLLQHEPMDEGANNLWGKWPQKKNISTLHTELSQVSGYPKPTSRETKHSMGKVSSIDMEKSTREKFIRSSSQQ